MKFYRKIVATILVGVLILSACSSGEAESSGEPQGGENTLNIFTWAGYFPKELLDEYAAETGATVNYTTFESNEEMLLKLEAAEGGQYDLIVASDYIIEIAREQELIAKIDKSLVPNFKNINPDFQNKYYDENNEYTVPYAAGSPAIIYNPALVDFEIVNYDSLWDERLADSIVVLDDMRNTMAMTLLSMGKSINETDPQVLAEAKEKLFKLEPNIRAMDSATPHNLVISGEVAAGYMFTSQLVTALNENADLKIVFPPEGVGFGIDSMLIPSNAPNSDNAHAFLNFMLDGQNSAIATESILYLSCNSAAAEFISSPALVLPDGAIENGEFMQDVGAATEIYNEIWTEFKLLD